MTTGTIASWLAAVARHDAVTPTLVAAGFGVLRVAIRSWLRRHGPEEFKNATGKRQTRAMLFLLSTLNGIACCVPYLLELRGFLKEGRTYPDPCTTVDLRTGAIPVDITAAQREATERSKIINRTALHIITGYLISDFIAILPEAREYPVDIFHHIIGLTCGIASYASFDRVYPFLGPFFFAEASTVLLNCMWFLREFPKASAQAANAVGIGALVRWAKGPAADPAQVLRDRVVPYLFAATFTLVRVVNFPRMLWALWSTRANIAATSSTQATTRRVLPVLLGEAGTAAIGLVTLLQFYWFGLIVKKFF